MEKKKVIKVLEYLSTNYTTFTDIQEKFDVWNETLCDYSYDEVIARINELMQRKEYATICPTLMVIISPLTKIKDKMQWDDKLFTCQFCGRVFNTKEESETHEDRCRSIRYIDKQYRRFGKGSVDKRVLYDMQEEEFQEKYKQLLKFVYDHSNNEFEKQVIANIFNPPKPEKAMETLNAYNKGE